MQMSSTNWLATSRNIQVISSISLIVLSLIFLLSSNSSAQWNRQSPVPTHLDVRGVGAPTAQRVFIATDDNSFDNGGALFESNDGGNTWIQRNIPLSLYDGFNGLFFLNSQYGWAYGNDNYRTTDGGSTWLPMQFLGSTYFMKFFTPDFGVTTGNFGIYISNDGGVSWNESPNGMFSFDFSDNFNGLGASENGIYRTTDAGFSFTQVFTGIAKSVVYLSTNIVIGIADGVFVRSTDGGLSWNSESSALEKSELLVVSSDVVLAWGRAGNWPDYDDRILRSSDGGQTWTDFGEPIEEGIFAITSPSQQSVVVSDFLGNMFHSSDAGLSWAQVFVSPGPQPGYLSSATPSFADTQIGYFGYSAGFVIKTTDGGVSWFQISSGTGQSLNDIDRFPNGSLIAVGDNGTILTSNGISPWGIHERFSQYNLKAVHVINTNEVVTIDEIGQVYLSSDGGANWTPANTLPPGLSPAEDIYFSTLQDGWVIGQGGTALYHTIDGGNTWIPVTEFGGAYVSIDVVGSNIWANNVTGIFYRSTDNGATWILGFLPNSPYQIQDIDFFDANIGYAVGWSGQAFRSEDGGATWQVLPTPNTDDQLTDLYLVGPNEFWISTNSNKAYYTANGGQGWAVLDIGSSGFGNFSAIAANSAGDAWTIGFQGYIEHFAGPPPPPLNQPPNASFNYDANGLTLNFTDTSTDMDGFIVNWSWDFGDGMSSNDQNPSHTYNTANTYIIQLTVTDDDGASNSTIQIIAIQPNPGGTFGDFTEVTPLDSIFVTPQDEDFWVITTAPADYDKDGDLDIAVLGYYVVYNQNVEDRLVLLVNNGPTDSTKWDFSYINVPLGTLTTGASDIAWGDADGDGDMDLAVGSDDQTVIYRNDVGTLILTDTNMPGYWEENSQAEFDLRSITWADFDNDGDFDLLIPSVFDYNSFSYHTSLMRNDGPNGSGGWIFTEDDSVFSPTVHAQSSWADYDGDQDLDLLLVNIDPLTDKSFIRRYRNEGSGTFIGEDILGGLTVEHGEAQWGDYDGDGDLDILIAGGVREMDSTYTSMALRVYRNDNENYVQLDVIDCIPCEGWFDLSAATWADYDSDGDMDILLAGNYNSGSNIEGRARIYTNSSGIFTADTANTLPAPRASGDRGGTFSWFDLDGDADLDYFIAGQYFVPGGNGLVEAQMHVYRNDVININTAPSMPTGLIASVQSDKSVTFSWIPSSDDHTPAPAITYDIVIVRTGTHVPIGKPNGTENYILTRLPEPGNISATTEWIISGLENGTYQWNLRAVDAAYIGSDIAVGNFNIGVVSVGNQDDNIPTEYKIEQNYPNPFNPTTTIRYSIPEDGPVALKVYNAIGKEMTVLVNENKHAGNYTIQFDASSLSSGVYFYQLRSGSFVETKKMILLK